MSKAKGSRTERELFHMFWNAGFAAVRAAGSGSTTLPAPDLLVGGKNKKWAIECKAIKGKQKYLYEKEIAELVEFSSKFGAEPYVGIRFDKIGWYFLPIDKLKKTAKGYYGVTFNLAKEHGIRFEELTK